MPVHPCATGWLVAHEKTSPLAAHALAAIQLKEACGFALLCQGKIHRCNSSWGARERERDGADSAAIPLWCQAKRLQDIVVRLRGVESLNSGLNHGRRISGLGALRIKK